MINWWNLRGLFLLLFLAWLPFMLPTLNIKGVWVGGGVLREWVAGYFLLLLPYPQLLEYKSYFMGGDAFSEYVAVIPGLLIITLVILWVIYIAGTLTIMIQNWITKTNQNSLRKSLKR